MESSAAWRLPATRSPIQVRRTAPTAGRQNGQPLFMRVTPFQQSSRAVSRTKLAAHRRCAAVARRLGSRALYDGKASPNGVADRGGGVQTGRASYAHQPPARQKGERSDAARYQARVGCPLPKDNRATVAQRLP